MLQNTTLFLFLGLTSYLTKPMRPYLRSGQLLDSSMSALGQLQTAPGSSWTAPDSPRTTPDSCKQLQTGPGQLQAALGHLQTAPGQLPTGHLGLQTARGQVQAVPYSWPAPVRLALQIQCIQSMHLFSASARGMYFTNVLGGCGG